MGAMDRLHDPNTLFGRLRRAAGSLWRAYCEHEFVRRLGDGSLPEACFRHYLEQDYLFLVHFSRAWALAAYKAESLADMRAAAAVLDGILNHEMELHVGFAARWGVSREALEGAPEAPANMAYTRYVLERGLAGDVLDLHVALAPCVVGYAEIGHRLAASPAFDPSRNPYAEWVSTYAGDEYQRLASEAIDGLERLGEARGAGARLASLERTFRQATTLEIGFWDMGMGAGGG